MLTDAARPTANLITVEVNEDGTASFALPRAEVGQGITTSTAMLIAEELDLPLDQVTVTLADARPELLFNQLTGGSNTTISTYTPIRVAAAIARQQLLAAAAIVLGAEVDPADRQGRRHHRPRRRLGDLRRAGRRGPPAPPTSRSRSTLKAAADFAVIGTPHEPHRRPRRGHRHEEVHHWTWTSPARCPR